MGLFQTADRKMAKSKIGEEEACLKKKKKKKKVQVKRCDIDNGDWTGEIDTAKDRESPTEKEAVAQGRVVAPRTGGRERDAAEQAPEDPTHAREQTRVERTIMTMTDDKVKEIIAKVQDCGGTITSDQLQEVIQGEDRRDEIHKDE